MSTMERTSTRDYWFADTLGRVLVGGEETEGRSCVVEVSGRRGSMPPLSGLLSPQQVRAVAAYVTGATGLFK